MKSPVLENGTPGSVRGQPGNRLSYRDDQHFEIEQNNYFVYRVIVIVRQQFADSMTLHLSMLMTEPRLIFSSRAISDLFRPFL